MRKKSSKVLKNGFGLRLYKARGHAASNVPLLLRLILWLIR